MAKYIQGSDVFIYLNEYGSTMASGVIACTKSDVLNLENEFLEITQIAQKNTEFLPSFQGFTMSVEQAVVADVSGGQLDTTAIENWAYNQTLLDFVFERPDGTAGTRTIAGQCYIKNVSISGGVNTGALCTFELQVSGSVIIA